MDPEPGYEDPDGPPPPPPEAVARSVSGWTSPSEPPRDGTGGSGPPPDGAAGSALGPDGAAGSALGPDGTPAAGPVAAEPVGTEPAGAWAVGAAAVPVTPAPPRRRRRWPLVLAGLLLVALAGTLVALVLTADEDGTVVADGDAGQDDTGDPDAADPDEPDTGSDDGDDDRAPDPDAERPSLPELDPDTVLDPLDLDRLDGLDLVYGQLLTDIDASEQEMIAFQTEVGAALALADSRDAGLAAVAEVAAAREQGLLVVRERLADPLDDEGAEEVRRLYVEHLDSWADLMGAVADEPLRILDQSESGATVSINRTADRFARALEAELPADIDAEVARFADELLDRGFRSNAVADV